MDQSSKYRVTVLRMIKVNLNKCCLTRCGEIVPLTNTKSSRTFHSLNYNCFCLSQLFVMSNLGQVRLYREWECDIANCRRTDGHGFESQTSTSACGHICKYMDQKGLAAMLTSAGVTPEVNLRITQERKHTRDPPWLWNPGEISPEVQNSGPTKKDLCKRKLLMKDR